MYSQKRGFIYEFDMIREPQRALIQSVPMSGQARRAPRAPPLGFAKIHVDAGVCKGWGGSAVAVCQDREGNYLGSSSLVIAGVDDPSTLEAIACRVALA
jgi:hypothetical protein